MNDYGIKKIITIGNGQYMYTLVCCELIEMVSQVTVQGVPDHALISNMLMRAIQTRGFCLCFAGYETCDYVNWVTIQLGHCPVIVLSVYFTVIMWQFVT